MEFVRLAGGILWREGSAGPRLAVIHRPRQADWSLPKGRLDEGETWEQAAQREVEEETGCEARITSFAGASSYLQRRTPRLVLYWHMALLREEKFEASKEVDELVWLAPAAALARLDHETERRVLRRSRPPGSPPAPRSTGALTAELAAARAEILRRVLSLSGKGNAAGLGPALDLLDRAEEAWAEGAAKEASAMTAEARRIGLLALSEPELSLRAHALREEARELAPRRRRAIRRLLSPDGEVSPEAVHLATALRDKALAERVRPARPIAAISAAAVAALALVLCLFSSTERGRGLLAALCGALAGAAIAALYYSRAGAKER